MLSKSMPGSQLLFFDSAARGCFGVSVVWVFQWSRRGIQPASPVLVAAGVCCGPFLHPSIMNNATAAWEGRAGVPCAGRWCEDVVMVHVRLWSTICWTTPKGSGVVSVAASVSKPYHRGHRVNPEIKSRLLGDSVSCRYSGQFQIAMFAEYAKHTVLPCSCAGTVTRLGRVARAVANPTLPGTRWKVSQISAASSDILSCPWPRTFDQDKVPPRLKGRGGITSTFAALRQVIYR